MANGSPPRLADTGYRVFSQFEEDGKLLFIFAALSTVLFGAIGSLLFAVGMGLMMPPLQSLSTRTVADELRGGVLGVYQSTISLSIIFSTAISGVIFAMSPTAPFWLGAGLSVLVFFPVILLVRQQDGITANSQQSAET